MEGAQRQNTCARCADGGLGVSHNRDGTREGNRPIKHPVGRDGHQSPCGGPGAPYDVCSDWYSHVGSDCSGCDPRTGSLSGADSGGNRTDPRRGALGDRNGLGEGDWLSGREVGDLHTARHLHSRGESQGCIDLRLPRSNSQVGAEGVIKGHCVPHIPKVVEVC